MSLHMAPCIYKPFQDYWMDKWFMDFDKLFFNKKEVLLYFLRKLCVEFKLRIYVKNFDTGLFHEVVHGFVQDGENIGVTTRYFKIFKKKNCLNLLNCHEKIS